MGKLIYIVYLGLLISCSIAPSNPKKEGQENIGQSDLNAQLNIYLKDLFESSGDYTLIPKSQRNYEYYLIDLNNDGSEEIFIKLVSPYFCGSGGCTILLLSSEKNLIQKFTVSDVFIIEPSVNHNWSRIWTQTQGTWRVLNHPYPSNPSMVKPTDSSPGKDFVRLEGSKSYSF